MHIFTFFKSQGYLNMKRTLFLSLFAMLLAAQSSFASHLMGGEITWKCQPDGRFVFYMAVYRDCNGIPGSFATQTLNSNSPAANIPMLFIDTNDASPVCNGDINEPHLYCDQAVLGGTDTGSIQEFLYRSNPVTLNGVPAVGGWTFSWTDCCRNSAIVNTNCGGYYLRAKMYAYNGKNTYPCFDSSPNFIEKPKSVICTGYNYTFNHNAGDDNLDSLRYDWAEPLAGAGAPCGYNAGFTYTNPLPDVSEDPANVQAVINPINGEINLTPYSGGTFVVCNKVSEYRCGVLIGEVFRDIQIILKTCRPLIANTSPPTINNSPSISPPFVDDNGQPSFVDTVYALSQVSFQINATDFDTDPLGNFQTLHFEPSGAQLSRDYTNPTDCLWPECATITPNPLTYTGSAVVNFAFDWKTDCSHLRQDTVCRIFNNIYNFVFKVYDDFCPIPGLNLFTVSIVVVAPPPLLPPTWNCASVDTNGHVTITWTPVADTLNMWITNYIYRATNETGPYTLIDSISDPTQLSYFDATANGHSNAYFYKISTYSGCDDFWSLANFPMGDYIRTSKLNVSNSGNGYANLTWNSTHTPLIPSNLLTYDIFKKVGNQPWGTTPIGSVPAQAPEMSYSDPVTICADTIHYRVRVNDVTGCSSYSSIDEDFFTDILPPSIPPMDSVSIDPVSGNAILAWFQDTTPDTEWYYILHFEGGNWIKRDSVFGITNTFYTSSYSALGGSETFRIYAADSCKNPSAWSMEMHTEFLSAELDACNSLIRVHWNRYINWPGAVNYAVYRSDNAGSFSLLTVSPDTLIEDYSIVQGHTYCYFVVAVDAASPTARTSTSNRVCVLAEIPLAPLFNYITTATVTGPGQVLVRAYADPAADVREYKVMRADAYAGPYMQVGTIPFTGTTMINFTDQSANTSEQSYYYRMIVTDTCGIDIDTSEVGRTILLTGSRNENFTNTVSWNEYQVWLGGVSYYSLFRSIDGVPDPAPLVANIAPGSTDFIDNYAEIALTTDGKFCYYVQAYEGAGNVYGFRDTSTSNETCVIASPIVFIPNAFIPGAARSDMNSEFNPFKLFVDVQTYSMRIFNRFGEEIYVTSATQKGWDGTFDGKPVEGGVYVYLIKMVANDQTKIERRGTVTLIR